jgi:hypothetical protein
MRFIISHLCRFRRHEDGVISIELIFVVPILVWALMSTMVYFDAYRAESISTRAALSVADMYSREEVAISPAFIDGSQEVLRLLSEAGTDPSIRVTVFRYREAPDDDFVVQWSQNRDYGDNLDDADIANLRDRIPRMGNEDRAILVETQVSYFPPFRISTRVSNEKRSDWRNMHWDSAAEARSIQFSTFTVIKPRFTNNFCFDPTPLDEENGDESC